jgi:AcrR family transcriptional regulator
LLVTLTGILGSFIATFKISGSAALEVGQQGTGSLTVLILLGNILILMSSVLTVPVKVDLERIRQEAAALANRYGLDGLSMSDLAQALNVRPPSLYSHVAGLADVKRLLALDGLAELEDGAARATIGKSGPDAVRALLNDYRDYVRKNPGVYAATVPTPPRSDREWSGAADRLRDTCLAALQGYVLRGSEAMHALRGLRSLGHGFASLELAGAMKDPVSRDQSFAWLVESFLAALEKMAARSRAKRVTVNG